MNLFLPSAPLQRSFTMLPYIFLYTFTVFLHSIPLGYPSTSFLQYFFSHFLMFFHFFLFSCRYDCMNIAVTESLRLWVGHGHQWIIVVCILNSGKTEPMIAVKKGSIRLDTIIYPPEPGTLQAFSKCIDLDASSGPLLWVDQGIAFSFQLELPSWRDAKQTCGLPACADSESDRVEGRIFFSWQSFCWNRIQPFTATLVRPLTKFSALFVLYTRGSLGSLGYLSAKYSCTRNALGGSEIIH